MKFSNSQTLATGQLAITFTGYVTQISKSWIISIILTISVIIQFNSIDVSGQSPSSKIDIINPDLRLLELLIKTKIDSLRNSYNLRHLYNDSICYLAAQDHGEYLMDFEDINHFQHDSPLKRSPQDRVNFYGASGYKAGENIIKIYLDIPFLYPINAAQQNSMIISTYQDAAKFIVHAWQRSAEHFVNILSDVYNITGVYAIINEDDRSLICVQVFAGVDENYNFKTYRSLFPYDNLAFEIDTLTASFFASAKGHNSDYPWGLVYLENSSNFDSSEILNKILSDCFILYRNNDVYLNLGPYNYGINLFENEFDGLALEIIPAKAYNCSENTALSNKNIEKSTENRIITKPIYKNKLLKKNLQLKQKNTEQKYLIPYAGTLPKIHADSFETNIIIIKNKKIWKAIQTHHLCGEMSGFDIAVPLYTGNISSPDDFQNYFASTGSEMPKVSDSAITLVAKNLTAKNLAENAALKYRHLFKEYYKNCIEKENNCSAVKYFESLDSIQKFLFCEYSNGVIDFTLIDTLPALFFDNAGDMERYQPFVRLFYDRLIFRYVNQPEQLSDSSLFNILSVLKKLRNPLPEVQYNYYALYILLHNNAVSGIISPANLREIIDIINRGREIIPHEKLKLLALFYHLQNVNINYQNEMHDFRRVSKSLEFIYNFYENIDISPIYRMKLANMFILFRKYDFAYKILLPAVNNNPPDKDAYILYLKLLYSGMINAENNADYYAALIHAANLLTDKEWVKLFEGPCRINFQHLNNKALRSLYCAKKKG